MLRLKINLRVRRSVRVKCPRHPRYNPERDGAGTIRGGCRYCVAIYELYAGKLAVERSLQALKQHIARCAVFNAAVCRKRACLAIGAEIDPNSAPSHGRSWWHR
jgi:hypothetical protein